MAMIFCYECGKKYSEAAKQCPACGAPNKKTALESTEKKAWVALLLAWFLGVIGAHRFYVGKTGSAVAMLILTMTLVGIIVSLIWSLVDMIVIVCGSFTDKDGNVLKF